MVVVMGCKCRNCEIINEYRMVKGCPPTMKTMTTQVREFIDKYSPCIDYYLLIQEEFEEWHEESLRVSGRDWEQCDELKELCDLLYVIHGYAIQRGWDIDEAFKRVHESNMTKDGGKNSEGKIMKGEAYKPPEFGDLV